MALVYVSCTLLLTIDTDRVSEDMLADLGTTAESASPEDIAGIALSAMENSALDAGARVVGINNIEAEW